MLPGDMVPYADNPRSHVKMRSKKSVERYFDVSFANLHSGSS